MSFFLTSISLSNVLVGQNDGLPNIIGSFVGGELSFKDAFTGAFELVNEETTGQGAPIGVDKKAYFNASKGETKTDGTLKTEDEHHVYGATNGVQPQNISIKLWKRIS